MKEQKDNSFRKFDSSLEVIPDEINNIEDELNKDHNVSESNIICIDFNKGISTYREIKIAKNEEMERRESMMRHPSNFKF